MTISEFRDMFRNNGFPQANVLHAKAADGREYGHPLYDLHAETPLALDMRYAALQGALRANGWKTGKGGG